MRIHQLTKNETIKIATKQSVNFQNYGKHQAYQKSEKKFLNLKKKSMHYLLLKSFGQRNLKQMSFAIDGFYYGTKFK